MQKKLLNKLNMTCFIAGAMLTPALACNGSHVLGVGGTGAAYTLTANTMQEGDFYFGVNAEVIQNRDLTDATIIEAMQNGASHLHNISRVASYSITSSYGITDRLTLNIQFPYVSRTDIRAGEEDGGVYEVHSHGNAQDIGDIAALFQYKIYDYESLKFALLGGIKVPTGKTDRADAGEVLEADLQPGSGSWDLFAGLAATKDFENFSFHSDILYKYNNKGVNESRLGDILTYNLAFSYKLIGHDHKETHTLYRLNEKEDFGYSVGLFFEFNGERAEKDSFYNITAENTGHNVVFATVGINLITHSNYSMFLSFSKPLYQDFNGLQNEISYKSSFGIGRSF